MLARRKSLSLIVLFLIIGCVPASGQIIYGARFLSGPFLLAPAASPDGSLDWAVVNNDSATANLRVTVYKLDLLGPKVPLDQVTFSLDPGRTFHNANHVGPGELYPLGFYYEVVVESTKENVQPNVNQWSCHAGSCFIPGTLIPAEDFVKSHLPPEKGTKQCSDGIDNDGDGLIDGADPDCTPPL